MKPILCPSSFVMISLKIFFCDDTKRDKEVEDLVLLGRAKKNLCNKKEIKKINRENKKENCDFSH
jgi:hypothetical protein